MRICRFQDADFSASLDAMCTRAAFDRDRDAGVADILRDVREHGDEALCRLARRYDGAELVPGHIALSSEEVSAAVDAVPAKVRKAVEMALDNVRGFAARRRPQNWQYSPRPGVVLGEKFVPFDRVGAYVPGGSAPLVSTVVHTIGLAAAAGVPELVVASPPGGPKGDINPAIVYAAARAGATETYRLGGVYAIGALAYGTESVRRVDKIVGPGNAYVAAAKRQVYGDVALDLVAGPSEVLIIADSTARPSFVAADLLAQAEHGSGREGAVLVTTSERILADTERELRRQAAALPDKPALDQVLAQSTWLILARDMGEATQIANRYAPEHLEVMTDSPDQVAAELTTAGAVFLGHWTPESCGDFVAGPSHVLPTGGTARFCSGLTVEHFYRRLSLVHYGEAALAREREAIMTFAEIEELPAHGLTAAVRGGAEFPPSN